MKLGLLNPAPLGPNLTKWGDYQFGRSLAAALERLNVEVEQRFWPEWDELGPVDVCVTLRGKRAHPPRRGVVNAVWIISHPAAVSVQELSDYDVVFAASETHRAILADSLDRPVHVLRQCTDTTIFRTNSGVAEDAGRRRQALLVANSRGIRRPALTAMLDAGFPVSIIGRHWSNLGLGDLVRENFVENDQLPQVYRDSRLALNDHWCDMKHFGIINNRIFDCLATGTPVITDKFPELQSVCGDAVLYFDDPQSLRTALRTYYFDYAGLLERTRGLWSKIGQDYTFDRRARQILDAVQGLQPGKAAPGQPSEPSADLEMLSAQIEQLKGTSKLASLQVLHVAPQPPIQHVLARRSDIDYITAGRGVGPWLVDLSDGLSILPKDRFHIIILDGEHGLDPMDLWPFATADGVIIAIDPESQGGGPMAAPSLEPASEHDADQLMPT